MQKHYFDEIEAYITEQGISAGEIQPRELTKALLNQELGFIREEFPADYKFLDTGTPGSQATWWNIVRYPYRGWVDPQYRQGSTIYSDSGDTNPKLLEYLSHFGPELSALVDAHLSIIGLPQSSDYLLEDFDYRLVKGPIIRIWGAGRGEDFDYESYGTRIEDHFSVVIVETDEYQILSDPNNAGRNYFVFADNYSSTSQTANRAYWRDTWIKICADINHHREFLEANCTPEQVILLGDYRKVRTEFSRVATELNELESAIEKREEEIRNMIGTYSALHRLQTDDKMRIVTMPKMLNSMAFSFARMGEGLEGMLQSDSRIISGSIIGDEIEFVTRPFNMQLVEKPWCGECDEYWNECVCDEKPEAVTSYRTIPSLQYTINVSNGYDQEYFQVTEYESDYENGYHPHVQDNYPCFGDAGLGIAEAWGRRDWESVVNIILAWHTVYNPESPYYPADELDIPLADVSRAGWVTNVPEEVTA